MAKMKVIGGSLNVRREPNTGAEISHVLADGEEITVGSEKDGWCKFGSGYVMARWLAPVEDTPDPLPEQDIREAAKEIKEAAKDIKAAAKKTSRKKGTDK